MPSARLIVAGAGVTLAIAACLRGHSGSLCPYDQSLQSSIATQFSSDTGVIAGRVVSIALEALGASRITLLPSGRHVETHADGSFRFDLLSAGSYELTVERPGYARAHQHIRILPNGGARVTATLGASVICLTD